MSGIIYKVTCTVTNKSYVGQATQYKIKDGKPYNYGVKGRWNDHVSSSKKSNTPLHAAIQQYGRDAFVLEEIEIANKVHLDALEAKWIDHFKTLQPHGYNVASHSRNRHHNETAFYEYYKSSVKKAVIRPIRRNNEWKLVYVMLYLNDDSNERIVFGQKDGDTFDKAMADATAFIKELDCPYEEETHNQSEFEKKI
jgi:group I intron endonuclease